MYVSAYFPEDLKEQYGEEIWLGTLLTGGGGHLPSGLSNQARDYGLGIFLFAECVGGCQITSNLKVCR
jgi:hypothetical protein